MRLRAVFLDLKDKMKFVSYSGLTFDDVLLVPQYSNLKTRLEADPSTKIGELSLKIPIISANMDSITGLDMAMAMGRLGAAGILHRYASKDEIGFWLSVLVGNGYPAIPSVGIKEEDYRAALEYRAITSAICVDIAHGDHISVFNILTHLKHLNYTTIIAGNVATAEGALRLAQAGANVIKVGIGPGLVCQTREVSGHGVPQLTAIESAIDALKGMSVQVIADGGMNSSGDMVKALAAGANAVMTGSLLAGTTECNKQGVYRGMASSDAQMEWKGVVGNDTPEGISQSVDNKGSVSDIVAKLVGGIRSGMSYTGARTLEGFRERALFIKVSPSTVKENSTRKV